MAPAARLNNKNSRRPLPFGLQPPVKHNRASPLPVKPYDADLSPRRRSKHHTLHTAELFAGCADHSHASDLLVFHLVWENGHGIY